MSKAYDSSPTSSLPFAALRGHVKHLDWIKNYRSDKLEKTLQSTGEDGGPNVGHAWALVTMGDRLDKMGELLCAVESLFEKAHRGDTSERSPSASFGMAMRLLGLSRELLEALGFDADDELERFCSNLAAQVIPQKKKTPKVTRPAAG